MNTKDHRDSVFQDINGEHAEMRTLLGRVHRVLSDRSNSVAEVVQMLGSLLDFLKLHFEHEDQGGGFFDQITEQTPRLSERADEVRQEHAGLLQEFQSLQDLAAQGTANDAWWDQLNSGFQRLSKHLMQHEHREEDLLQESFNDDIGAGD